MMDVYIIGVANHAFQVPGKKPEVEANAFMSLLQITCRQYQIRAIAEEMSPEALSKDGQQESTCKHVADSLRLSRRYCDPNLAKRRELGIIEKDDIHWQKFYENLTDEEVRKKIRAEYEKREGWWLKELNNLGVFPVLFICGAKHAKPFAELVSQNNLSCEILYKNWSPDCLKMVS
jgi:hypothetical protein